MTEIWKNKSLRKKILILIGTMTLIRIGSQIPIPGVNTEYMKVILENSGLSFINMMTGSSFSQMSLFALSISPYITASIVFQLLAIAVPAIEEWHKDGKTGKEKLERATVILAMVLALIQALFMSIGLGRQGLLEPYTWWMAMITTTIWTGGAGLLIYIGNRITKLNIGSGISYILLFNILSTFPQDLYTLYEIFMSGKKIQFQIVYAVIIAMIFAAIVIACIGIHLAAKKIPTTFSGKMANGYTYKHDLPIPLNACGVMPIIFSGTIISVPLMISNFLPEVSWLNKLSMYLNERNWFNTITPQYSLGAILYIVLTLVFAVFYLDITLNPMEMANNLRQQGAVIPGIRPGKPTADYLKNTIKKVGMFGAVLVLALILVMTLICNCSGASSLSIGGTSILICVNVVIDSAKAIRIEQQSSNPYAYKSLTGSH